MALVALGALVSLANSQQLTANSQQLTANSQQLTANSQQLIASSQQLISNFRTFEVVSFTREPMVSPLSKEPLSHYEQRND